MLAYPLRVSSVKSLKMVRTPTIVSTNRSLLVLLVLLLALVAIAAARTLVANSFQPAAPIYAPVEDPAPIAPAVDASSAPFPAVETAAPALRTALPAPASLRPVAPAAPAATAGTAATAAPHATVPVGPPTTAAPGRDIHSIAPEPGMPGFNPPPGRE